MVLVEHDATNRQVLVQVPHAQGRNRWGSIGQGVAAVMLVERIELSLVVVVVVLIVVLVAVVGLQVVASLVVHGLLQAGLVAKLVLVVYSGVSEGM